MKAKSAVLFIVGSPLQLINAYEARNCLCRGADCDLVIGLSIEQKNNGQMDALLGLLAWRHIYRVPAYGPLQPLRFRTLVTNMLSNGRGPYESIFIGEPHSIFFRMFASTICSFAKIVYVDDGFSTLDLVGGNQFEGARRFPRLKILLSGICGLSMPSTPTRAFFSAFPEIFCESKGFDLVEINRYSWLREIISKSACLAETPHTAFLLGENLRECGLVNNNVYEEIVRKIRLRFQHFEVVYLPHRRELPRNVKKLCDKFNMKHLHLETAVEVGFFMAGINPSIIISLQSTALATLPLIYPTASICVISIKNSALGNSRLGAIVKIKHSYLRQINLKNVQFLDVD
jgi:hypothetical protein